MAILALGWLGKRKEPGAPSLAALAHTRALARTNEALGSHWISCTQRYRAAIELGAASAGSRDRQRSGGQQRLDPGASEAGLVARTTRRRLDPGGEAPNPQVAEAGEAGDELLRMDGGVGCEGIWAGSAAALSLVRCV